MKALIDILKLSTHYLQKCGVERARYQAEEIFSSLLNLSRTDLYMQFDRPLLDQELDILRAAIKRKALGEPWQYIVGEIEFFGAKIKLAPTVLIPRQETEIFVDFIDKSLIDSSLTVWDICTGSGCIAVSLKKKRPDLKLVASDISPQALEVARYNSLQNRVDIEFLQGDLFSPFQGKKTNVIICNPPYVSEQDYDQLDPLVKDWEPYQALVAGKTGLEFYQRFADQAFEFLLPNGALYLEIGAHMGNKVKNLFKNRIWKDKKVFKDWAGHDRYIAIQT